MCPHILRYLATAVIINRSRRNALKDLVKVIQQEAYTYRYPATYNPVLLKILRYTLHAFTYIYEPILDNYFVCTTHFYELNDVFTHENCSARNELTRAYLRNSDCILVSILLKITINVVITNISVYKNGRSRIFLVVYLYELCVVIPTRYKLVP